ncbi:MAG: adenylyltransferase/cytidyltransferase family protein, partial [Firmicutes bacterium]|nr:adenylyltransferase/cytidyltransferase family protein [Bacillota bacterium]
MIVFKDIAEIKDTEPCAVALGTFDGVHLGHQKLIGAAVERAKELGIKAGVFTFSNHPRDLLPNAKPVKNILYSREKEEILAGLGVDYLFDVPFTREIMEMDPERYVSDLLVGRCSARVLACGTDHRFGYKAKGDPALLRELGEKLGFEALIVDKLEIEGNEVSSSLIR